MQPESLMSRVGKGGGNVKSGMNSDMNADRVLAIYGSNVGCTGRPVELGGPVRRGGRT